VRGSARAWMSSLPAPSTTVCVPIVTVSCRELVPRKGQCEQLLAVGAR
jgi:hypothetical protein